MCKEVFKAVYDISNGRLGRILKRNYDKLLQLPKDQRGGKTRALDLVTVELLTSVLTRMPKYVVQYEWHKNKDDNFAYMEPGCTWDKVYELVKEEISFWLKKIKQSYQVRLCSMKKLRSYFLMLKHTSHQKKSAIPVPY